MSREEHDLKWPGFEAPTLEEIAFYDDGRILQLSATGDTIASTLAGERLGRHRVCELLPVLCHPFNFNLIRFKGTAKPGFRHDGGQSLVRLRIALTIGGWCPGLGCQLPSPNRPKP